MKYKALALTLAFVGIVTISSTARAELIHGVSVTDNGVTDSSPAYASDGIADDVNKWYSKANGGDYFAAGTTPVLTIDLGGSYSLSGVAFWNYNVYGNSTKTFTLEFSTDGLNYGSSTNFTSGTPVNTPTYFLQEDYALSTVTARYVKMTVTDSWCDGVNPGGDRVGFADIQFAGTTIPEPTSMVILATGFAGLLAYAWRKRK